MRVVPRHLFDTWCMMVIMSISIDGGDAITRAVYGRGPNPCTIWVLFSDQLLNYDENCVLLPSEKEIIESYVSFHKVHLHECKH